MRRAARFGFATVVAAASAVAASPAPASAQADARVRTEVDTTLVTVGDRIGVRVSVDHPLGTTVAWPDSVDLAPFEVLQAIASPPAAVEGGLRSTLALSVTAFELGELELPSFPVTVLGGDGGEAVLETDAFAIVVESVGADEGGDIREIRGPLGIPLSPLRVLGLLVLLLVPVLLAVWMYRRRRPREEDDAPSRATPPRPAHELALEALAELEASGLLERGEVKRFHIEASEIVRLYVERRFRIDALEMTTREVIEGMEAAGVDGATRGLLRRFLGPCDLVKFAKSRPDRAASTALLELAREIVRSTTPRVPIPDVDVPEPVGAGG